MSIHIYIYITYIYLSHFISPVIRTHPMFVSVFGIISWPGSVHLRAQKWSGHLRNAEHLASLGSQSLNVEQIGWKCIQYGCYNIRCITLRTSGWFCMFPRIFPPREGWNTSWCKARWKSLEAHPGALMGFPACFECPSELHRSSDPEVLKFIFLVTEGNHIGTDLPITIYHALWLSSSKAFKGCIV